MAGIRRIRSDYDSVGLITDSDSDSNRNERIRYCNRCLNFGVRAGLGPRFYLPTEQRRQVSEEEREKWLMCENCLSVYAKYEVKIETNMGPLAEPSDSPFSSVKDEIKGIGESRRYDRSGKTQTHKKKKQDLSDIKDKDLTNEIASGAKLLSYHES